MTDKPKPRLVRIVSGHWRTVPLLRPDAAALLWHARRRLRPDFVRALRVLPVAEGPS